MKITTGSFPRQDVVEAPTHSIETALEKLPGIVEANLQRTKIPGAGTCLALISSLDVGIVVLTNAGPIDAAEAVGAEFMDCAQFGAGKRNWVVDYGMALSGFYTPAGDLAETVAPARPAPSDAVERLAGTMPTTITAQSLCSSTPENSPSCWAPEATMHRP